MDIVSGRDQDDQDRQLEQGPTGEQGPSDQQEEGQVPTGLGSGSGSGLGHSLTSEPEPLLGGEGEGR